MSNLGRQLTTYKRTTCGLISPPAGVDIALTIMVVLTGVSVLLSAFHRCMPLIGRCYRKPNRDYGGHPMKTSALISFFSLLIAVPSYAQNVIRDGKEWLQPADFLGLRWTDDVVAICPAPSFECTGTLNTTDVTGYTLASIEDVTALLNSYIGTSTPLTSAPDQKPVTNDEFDALRADFLATTNDGRIRGQSSTVSAQNNDWPFGGGTLGDIDSRRFTTSSVFNPDFGITNAGHWFYRPAIPVTTYNVTASVSGGNGTVACSPTSVASGGTSTCTASPDSGFQVIAWTGDCVSAGTSNTCSLTNIQADRSSTVSFEVSSTTPPPVVTPTRPIPVMPLWLMGLMALALAGIASTSIRRKH